MTAKFTAWLRRLADGVAIALPVIALQWAVFGVRLQAVETAQAVAIARHELDRSAWTYKECLDFRKQAIRIPHHLAADCRVIFQRLNLEYIDEQFE